MKIIYLFLTLFLVSPFFSTSQTGETTPIKLDKISDNLYQIFGGRGANGGMYIGDNEVLIIDSKMDKTSVDGIYEAVKKITNKPISILVNTHSDGDHINGNQYFPESVTIIGHENCRKEFLLPQRDGSASIWQSSEMLRFVPKVTFNDKMRIHLGSKTIELYYFGVGHTTGDIVLYFPDEKTAFIGDQVFFGRPQLIHSYKGGNSFEHVKTTQKMLAAVNAEKFCSGHAEIKFRMDMENHIKEITAFQQKIKTMVNSGKTMEETKSAFEQNEARLVESVYNEIKAMKQ
ncbi:MAG: MBL fold metallo-hydrolase [Prolixibacteraceae bacterium]|jgi:cyclase|nr:MBL fold metallo-hydrolase [Prolixibacteraceae bacterium]MBT6005102.1 MBL fold metallo-hydrolase [Prolixibacteraceae bacterium]MBT6763473.1 MBL fold metallo-hydrolase [Prolixibacteraceae bacterium]MBT6998056.1 MBL fold metallo-hydrolase [Prolixibacteraceae bacterium]MBT7395199.1 MBL fold metallo-hydrolase [Prolixibacteraceae bacterium]